MKTVHAFWKNGQIVPTEPIDWPDGTTLSIEPMEGQRLNPIERDDDLWGDDRATIARRIAFYEALPSLKMSVSEEAEWQAARREMKDYTIAKMQGRPAEDRPRAAICSTPTPPRTPCTAAVEFPSD